MKDENDILPSSDEVRTMANQVLSNPIQAAKEIIALRKLTEQQKTAEPYHLSSEEQGVMRKALRKSVKIVEPDPQSDMVAVPREVINRLRNAKEKALISGSVINVVCDIDIALSMLQPYTKGE